MDGTKVASSFDELFQAATEEANEREVTLPYWKGMGITVRDASAQDQTRLRRQLREGMVAGRHMEEDVLTALSWIAACVVKPKLTVDQVVQLWDKAPADMSNLATICQSLSSGMPMPRIMLGVWGNTAAAIEKAVEKGEVGPGALHFWTSMLKVFGAWMDSGGGLALNFRDLGRALCDIEDGAGIEDAAQAVRQWAQDNEVDLGNEPEAESSPSSASASSGPDAAPTNSPSQDGPTTTSTDCEPLTA